MKKWNWEIFWFILLLSLLGAASNKNIPTITQCFMLAGMFGIPFGLFWAWATKND